MFYNNTEALDSTIIVRLLNINNAASLNDTALWCCSGYNSNSHNRSLQADRISKLRL